MSKSRPGKRLSPWRVMFAILLVATAVVGGVFGYKWWEAERVTASNKPWFAPYVDVTATPKFAFEQIGTAEPHDMVLSFIVALSADSCTPAWGGAYTMTQAGASLDLDRRIARLKQQGGNVAVSFGGLKNDELAVVCADETKLLAAYRSVIDRYELDTIDFDLELGGLTDANAAARRASVIAKLQAERREDGKNLAVWVTLPVAPQGLTEAGTNAVTLLLEKGVDLAGVNVMTMNYGESREGQSMLEASQSALVQTHRQLSILYERAGIQLSNSSVWAKIGATPMIGQNEFTEEVFTLDDAQAFNEFARSKGVGRMSMWSANRDTVCGGNYVDVKLVSDSCSGVDQDKGAFAVLLGAGFDGTIAQSAAHVTKPDPTAKTVQQADDPKDSPYQIWTENGAYLAGTKVVWHRNVYEAKWWTQGDMPDNPVLQTWETPWRLIGPVLPGEKPVPQATLPAGTYPEWDGTVVYDTGQRVLFKGVPYQAKWWNQGQSPAAASSSADTSPWVPLTQAQINEIESQLRAD